MGSFLSSIYGLTKNYPIYRASAGEGGDEGGGTGDTGDDDGGDDIETLKAELARARKKADEESAGRRKLLTEAKTLKEQMKQFEGIDPAKVRELLDAEEARKTKEDQAKGNFDSTIKNITTKHEEERRNLETRAEKAEREADELFVAKEVTPAFVGENGLAKLSNRFLKVISDYCKVERTEDGRRQLAFVDDNGLPIRDAKGKTIETASELMTWLKTEADYGGFFKPEDKPKGTGMTNNGAAGGGRSSGQQGVIVINRNDPRAVGAAVADLASGKAVLSDG